MRRLIGVAAAVVAVTALVGCARPGSSAERRADEIADDALADLESYKGRFLDETAAVASRSGEVMGIRGDVWDGGVTVVLQVEASAVERDGFTDRETHVVRCYELFVHKRPDTWVAERSVVDCPAGGPLVLDPPPRMPVGATDALAATLAAEPVPTPPADEVRAAVVAAIPGREVEVEVVHEAGATGVAVRVRGDCVLGRVVGGVVEAWNPPDVLVQPGELGCTASVAAAGGAKHPPH